MAITPDSNKQARPAMCKVKWIKNDDEVRLPASRGGYVFSGGKAVDVPQELADELLLQTENFQKGE